MAISRRELLAFMQQELYAVQATVATGGAPQAALVGVVVSDRFEVFFDTLRTSRKSANLRRHSAVALVMGPTDAEAVRTVQCEGAADEPTVTTSSDCSRSTSTGSPTGGSAGTCPTSPTCGSRRSGSGTATSPRNPLRSWNSGQ